MTGLILGFLTAFFLVLIATPVLIKVAKMKHLVDEPGEARKLHSRSVPTIGGIMIFAGTIIAYSLWFPARDEGLVQSLLNADTYNALNEFKYIVASLFILFFMGVKDDIIGMSPTKKLLIHFVVGGILVLVAGIRINYFHGLFGLGHIPEWASISLSLFTYIVIVNAFNLIDGIDGLASTVGLLASLAFALWFYQTNHLPLTLLALALAGSLAGFLVFNFNPAKIFMGDSGSLIIGAVLFVLSVRLIELPWTRFPAMLHGVSKPVLVMAILAYPLVDTLRVFFIRIVGGRSPFSADRNHIHHRLLDFGLGHKQIVLVVLLYSLAMIALPFFMPDNRPNVAFVVVFAVALGSAQMLWLIKPKKTSADK
jgi:UDP-GlcNAc:undecaprenyl-phosphate/decaprenyl-phosphate GlcNAc-1-phosphate transferase